MNTKTTTTEEVYRKLKGQLASFKFKPGQSLTEEEIASSLKVSRTPIRAALSRLETEGAIELIPHKGAFVKLVSVTDVIEIYQIRNALEGKAAKLAAAKGSVEAIKGFRHFYSEGIEVRKSAPVKEIFDFGLAVHDFIIELAGNQRIRGVLAMFRLQLDICRNFLHGKGFDPDPLRAAESVREHMAILRCLGEKDGNGAEELMKRHIFKAMEYTLSFRGLET